MKNSTTKAMVLAAGKGTRLMPLTLDTPKPLLPVGDVPIIIRQINWLKQHGITEVVINLFRMGEKFQAELGDGSRFGIDISYSIEDNLLGTAGGLKRMEHLFDETFSVIYSDILTDFNLLDMMEFHKNRKALMTINIIQTTKSWEVGIVELDTDGRLKSFTEKPEPGAETSNLSNGGIYILEPDIFKYIPADSFCDFGFHIIPKLLQANLPVYGYELHPDDYLIDVGNIEKYQQADRDVRNGIVKTADGKPNR